MTSITFPPHANTIPVTFQVKDKKDVILLQPSPLAFTLELPEDARLIGEFGVDTMAVDSASDLPTERLG